MTGLTCPKCGEAELRYQEMFSASCERCPGCGWLSLGYSHAEVVRMCKSRTRRDERHHTGCTVRTWAAMAAEADVNGEPVPDAVRRLAVEEPQGGIAQCHRDCPSLARDIERGRELAERFGW